MIHRPEIQQALGRFSERLRSYQLAIVARRPGLLKEGYALIQDFEILSGHLYRVRAKLPPSDPLRLRLEDFMANAAQELVALEKPNKGQHTYRRWVNDYRRIWKENLNLFLFTAFVFLASIFVAWQTTVQDPQYVAAFVPQQMIEQIIEKTKWFEELQKNPLLGGYMIAQNNIQVSILAFALGGLCGIGGLYILVFNGLMFGALMGFCYVNNFDQELTQFVVGHGPLELTIIVASAFAGFMFGRVFYMRPYRLFRVRMGQAAREAGVLLSGILPWLCLAAFIEAFVSPWPGIALGTKLGIGALAAFFFWLWTLWPADRALQARRAPK